MGERTPTSTRREGQGSTSRDQKQLDEIFDWLVEHEEDLLRLKTALRPYLAVWQWAVRLRALIAKPRMDKATNALMSHVVAETMSGRLG